jgi:HD-GYP domain-containing protein (c-di-GMP phosphodiesterase class II)
LQQANANSFQLQTVAVPVPGLRVGMFVSALDCDWEDTPFLLQGFEIKTEADIDEIAQHCEFVYVDVKQSSVPVKTEKKAAKGNSRLRPVVSNHREYRRAQSAYGNVQTVTKSFMDEVALGQAINVQEVTKSVSDCVQSVLRNPDTMHWVARMRNEDEYTSEHCMNVALLAITFGRHLGLGESDLLNLGFAGIVHDVGKMRIPPEVLNKPGALSDEEYQIMRTHTTLGRDILMAHKNIYAGVVDAAYAHHETLDGGGYPRNLSDSGITKFTRIITICDIYDAITSDRVYKKGRPSTEALGALYKLRGTKVDARLTEEFIRCVGLYPLGSVVEMADGEVGVVISANHDNRRFPKVLLLRDAEKKRCTQRVIDTQAEAKRRDCIGIIKTVLPNGSYGVRIEKLIEEGLVLA